MAPGDEPPIDAKTVAGWFLEHGTELQRFVLGVLKDAEAAKDVTQAVFVKALERGQEARDGSVKGWLFRIAFNEAIDWRRRQAAGQQAVRKLSWMKHLEMDEPARGLVRAERIEQVKQAIAELPTEQQAVVVARMHEGQTFAEIAAQQGLPLGTVLTRMRLAMEKLRRRLAQPEDES